MPALTAQPSEQILMLKLKAVIHHSILPQITETSLWKQIFKQDESLGTLNIIIQLEVRSL